MKQEITLHDKVFVPFITAEQIRVRVADLGREIHADYKDKNPMFIGILSGSVIFLSDLVRSLDSVVEMGFMRISSYSGTSSSGKVKSLLALNDSIKDRHVILVEDIIDTGDTAKYLIETLNEQEPASLTFATLLFKPASLRQEIQPKYIGFTIPPDFVVGYGLDYDGLGRNLNDIYTLKP